MAKSAVKVKKPKTVPPEISEAKSGKTRASLHNDNTPRSTIQNVLREGTESLFPIWITRSHDLSIHLHLIAFLVFHIYIYIYIYYYKRFLQNLQYITRVIKNRTSYINQERWNVHSDQRSLGFQVHFHHVFINVNADKHDSKQLV